MSARPHPLVNRSRSHTVSRKLLRSYLGGAFTYLCWSIAGALAGRSGGLRRFPRVPRARLASVPFELPRLGLRGRLAGGLAWLLILAGALALTDAVVTLFWQEPITAIYTAIRQDELNGSLRALERAQPSQAVAQRLAVLHRVDERIGLLAQQLETKAGEGSAVGRIEIPRIGASFVLVNGTGTEELEEGPGIYSRTSYPQRTFPGLAGTTAIAGHRTTYLAPFRHIDELHSGDSIVVTMPYGRFTYTVTGHRVVLPSNVAAAVAPVGHPRIVLSACTPLFSASHRILVFGRLTASVPLGAAREFARNLAHSSYTPSQLANSVGIPDRGLKENI
jgi:sortase A